MALTECEDCGHQVSTNAHSCPNCGAPIKKQIQQPERSPLMLVIFIIGLFVLTVGGVIFLTTPSYKSSSYKSSSNYSSSPKEKAIKNTSLNYTWVKGGFGSIIEGDFTIKNDNNFSIKDIEIECVYYANSGTKIDSNSRTIYEIVPARQTKTFKNFNMGFIDSQVKTSACRIEDIKM